MPYPKKANLPDSVKDNLPAHAQDIYKEAFNHALIEYMDPKKRNSDESLEEVAHKVAWAAVKQSYIKDEKSGKWKTKH